MISISKRGLCRGAKASAAAVPWLGLHLGSQDALDTKCFPLLGLGAGSHFLTWTGDYSIR